MQLRQQYFESGGTDPKIVLQLNNLEAYYKHNHPVNVHKSLHIESFADSFKEKMFTTVIISSHYIEPLRARRSH